MNNFSDTHVAYTILKKAGKLRRSQWDLLCLKLFWHFFVPPIEWGYASTFSRDLLDELVSLGYAKKRCECYYPTRKSPSLDLICNLTTNVTEEIENVLKLDNKEIEDQIDSYSRRFYDETELKIHAERSYNPRLYGSLGIKLLFL